MSTIASVRPRATTLLHALHAPRCRAGQQRAKRASGRGCVALLHTTSTAWAAAATSRASRLSYPQRGSWRATAVASASSQGGDDGAEDTPKIPEEMMREAAAAGLNEAKVR